MLHSLLVEQQERGGKNSWWVQTLLHSHKCEWNSSNDHRSTNPLYAKFHWLLSKNVFNKNRLETFVTASKFAAHKCAQKSLCLLCSIAKHSPDFFPFFFFKSEGPSCFPRTSMSVYTQKKINMEEKRKTVRQTPLNIPVDRTWCGSPTPTPPQFFSVNLYRSKTTHSCSNLFCSRTQPTRTDSCI